MSCCGQTKNRIRLGHNVNASTVDKPVLFEYFGRTALTIVGPATGTAYRFEHPGARVIVDPRDSASLNAVPVLMHVRSM
jgi:hypothetical protein